MGIALRWRPHRPPSAPGHTQGIDSHFLSIFLSLTPKKLNHLSHRFVSRLWTEIVKFWLPLFERQWLACVKALAGKFVTAAWVETCHTEQRLVPWASLRSQHRQGEGMTWADGMRWGFGRWGENGEVDDGEGLRSTFWGPTPHQTKRKFTTFESEFWSQAETSILLTKRKPGEGMGILTQNQM